MVIPLLANQDLTPMLLYIQFVKSGMNTRPPPKPLCQTHLFLQVANNLFCMQTGIHYIILLISAFVYFRLVSKYYLDVVRLDHEHLHQVSIYYKSLKAAEMLFI